MFYLEESADVIVGAIIVQSCKSLQLGNPGTDNAADGCEDPPNVLAV